MNKNLLLCAAGIILGFIIGFFIANAMTKNAPLAASTNAATESDASAASAPPLDPSQTNGQLPPNHPPINGAGATNDAANSLIANSTDAQTAMDAADRNPNNFEAQMAAAAIFYQAKDLPRAVTYLERALKIKPNDVDALTAMGNVKYDMGDFVSAANYYEKSLAIKPNDPDVRTDYGNTFFRRTPPDYARAISEYRKSLAIDPKHEKTLENMIAAAGLLNDTATARDAAQKLLAIDPNNEKAKAVLGK